MLIGLVYLVESVIVNNMGARIIFLDKKRKVASRTTIPMKVVENYTGLLSEAPEFIMERLLNNFITDIPSNIDYKDLVIESDAYGQIDVSDFVFDDTKENGYYIKLKSWAW